MQCTRAQDQFSDYLEGVLTAAMRQVLEQHFSVCGACRAEIEQFRSAYALLDEGLPELDVPPGFRASVLNAIREQPVPSTWSSRIRDWFLPGQPGFGRRTAAMGLAAFAVLAMFVGGHFYGIRGTKSVNAQGQPVAESALLPWQSIPVSIQNQGGILQSVKSYWSSDGNTYHVFGLHLPAGMPATTATAYVIQSPTALTDDAALQNSDDATLAWSDTIKPGTSIQVPVQVVSNVPAGTSMTLLLVWSDNAGEHKQACILPISAPSSQPMVVSSGEPLYQALQTVAVAYRAPIMLNDAATAQLTQLTSQGLDGSDRDINDSLADVVQPANLTFQKQADGSYLIDNQ